MCIILKIGLNSARYGFEHKDPIPHYNRFLHYAGANNEASRIWNIRLCDTGEFSVWQPGWPEPSSG
jgi:hypothetical protein